MNALEYLLTLPIRLFAKLVRALRFLFDFIWTFAQGLLNPANLIIVMLVAVGIYVLFFMEKPPEFRL